MNNFYFMVILSFVGQSVAQDCWWTGCQPNSWAVKGCAQYNRQERGKQACHATGGSGHRYHCCAGGGGPVKPPPRPKPNPGGGGGKQALIHFKISL